MYSDIYDSKLNHLVSMFMHTSYIHAKDTAYRCTMMVLYSKNIYKYLHYIFFADVSTLNPRVESVLYKSVHILFLLVEFL